jgi:hypothetical protein
VEVNKLNLVISNFSKSKTTEVMKAANLKIYCLAFLFFTATSSVLAQGGKLSPAATATGKIGDANVKISYSSPSVKGRKIFGDLVPYGQVWRAGANEATTLETDKDLIVEGKKLPAGKYSIYAIPNEKEWQFIINSQTGQWGVKRNGETTRVPENDVIVATVKPMKASQAQEKMQYEITNKGIVFKWADVELPVSVSAK